MSSERGLASSERGLAGPTPHSCVIADIHVELHAERALHFPSGRTLFVSDVHLGKSAAFRSGGVPMPSGVTDADLARLTRLLAITSAEHLVVLGDFLHAKSGRTDALDDAFVAWRTRHRQLSMTLVRGNHDSRAGDPPAGWGFNVVTQPYASMPFMLYHEPPVDAEHPDLLGYGLAGHIHPGVHVAAGAERERLPCFVLGRSRAILPAFGRFTGLAVHAWSHDERVVAIAGARLFELPR